MTTSSPKLNVPVVTGGHAFDVPPFYGAFEVLGNTNVFIQHMDDWAFAGAAGRAFYDCVVFYHMFRELPGPDAKWYQGNVREAVEELGLTDQGIVVLHHAITAYPNFPAWRDVVGTKDLRFTHYHVDQSLHIHVATQEHPITHGLADWDMIDETYEMADAAMETGNTVLLTVDHPKSVKTIAWTRHHGESRVFCYQSGHDAKAFGHPEFGKVLSRGVQCCARRASPTV